MSTSSHACPVPAVRGHMTHYPAAPYPLLFPPVIRGLSLPPLHGLHGHPPPSGCSTPSPASVGQACQRTTGGSQFAASTKWTPSLNAGM
ncbi:mCG147698, partial [Mus musculus]